MNKIKKYLIDQDVVEEFVTYLQTIWTQRTRLIEHLVKATNGYSIRDLVSLVDMAFDMVSHRDLYLLRGAHFKEAIKVINIQLEQEKKEVAGKNNQLSGLQKTAYGAQAFSNVVSGANAAMSINNKVQKLGGWKACWTYVGTALKILK